MSMATEIWMHAFAAVADPRDPVRRLVTAGIVPDPAPAAPTAVTTDISTLLGWWKWAAIVAGVFGLTLVVLSSGIVSVFT
jgi:hypothetical protein